jgi:hypothetical protein
MNINSLMVGAERSGKHKHQFAIFRLGRIQAWVLLFGVLLGPK